MYFVAPGKGWQEGKFSVLNEGLGGKPYCCGTFATEEEAREEADRLNVVHGEDVENHELPDDMLHFLSLV